MLRFEIKKVFSKTVNKIALLILVVALLVVSFFAVNSVDYVDENGTSTSGIAAARNLRNDKNQWSGYLTDNVLSEAILKNEEIIASPEYLSKDVKENDKAYAKMQGFSDIRTIINKAFCSFNEYDYYRANSVTSDEVRNLYERRITNLTEWLNSDEIKDNFSKDEKEFLITQYNELETPFYYEYSDGWKALLEYAPSIMMLLVLILGFLVSSIFSNEFQLKADSIFFSAKLGRNKAINAKMRAGFLIITAVYWGTMLIYSAVVLGSLGTDGANCMIQTGLGGWKSFYNITCLQDYLLTMAGGYLGSLFILTLSMLVSAKTHSTTLAVTVPFILLFIPSFFSGISVLSKGLGLLPDQLLQVSQAVNLFNLYKIGGKVVGAIPIIMILYFILHCILLPMLYSVYQKAEIK